MINRSVPYINKKNPTLPPFLFFFFFSPFSFFFILLLTASFFIFSPAPFFPTHPSIVFCKIYTPEVNSSENSYFRILF